VNTYVRALGQAAKQLGAATARNQVLQTAVDLLLTDVGGELAVAWLRQEHGQSLQTHGRASLMATPLESADTEILRSWAETVLCREAPFIHDLPDPPSLSPDWPQVQGARSVAVVPLVVEGEVVGALLCLSHTEVTDDRRELLVSMGWIVSMALDRAALWERVQLAAAGQAREALGLAAVGYEDEVVAPQVSFPGLRAGDSADLARPSPFSTRQEERSRLDACGSERRYGLTDLAFAENLTRRAAPADQARLYEETLKVAVAQGAILRQMVEGIVLVDGEGQITLVNEASRRLLGVDEPTMSFEEFLQAFDVLTPDGQVVPWEDRSLSRALFTGEPSLNVDRRIRRADGTEIVAESSAVPVVAADGTRIGAVLTFRDVTQQRTMDRQKDEFLSAIAHDLKSPLTTIKGFTQLLQLRAGRSDVVEAAQILEGLARIDATTERMRMYVDELLDTSRVQMGRRLEFSPSRVDLVGLVKRAVAECQESAPGHQISVETSHAELMGAWDANRMERVLTNLLSNAVKYSPGGGQIVLSVCRDDRPEGAVITVRDEGLGIPPADLPLIFDRFHRAQNVPRDIPGTGIGLTAVRQIVEQQGGAVSVESVEGEGTTFTVRLPLASADSEAE